MPEQVERRAMWVSKAVENARAVADCPSCGSIVVLVAVADAVFIRLKTMGPILFDGTCANCGGPARMAVQLRPTAEL